MKKMVQQQPRFDEAHICVMKSLSMDKSMSPPCQFHNTGFIYFKPKIISLNKTSEVMEKKHLKFLFLLSLGTHSQNKR